MARSLLLALCGLAFVSYASAAVGGGGGPMLDRPTTYTQLQPLAGQWQITMEATKGKSNALFLGQACSSPDITAPCNQPLLTAATGDRVRVTAKLNQTQLRTDGGLPAAGVVLRLCFSKPFVADRPWRKPNDKIDLDRSCPPAGAVAKLAPAGNNTYTGVWKVPKSAPKATWYAMVLVECANGTDKVFCQYDSTKGANFVGTQIIESVPASLKIAAALCSAIAPVFLLAFFIKERVAKKAA